LSTRWKPLQTAVNGTMPAKPCHSTAPYPLAFRLDWRKQRNPFVADEPLYDGPESDRELDEEYSLHDESLVIEVSDSEKDEELDQGAAIGTGKGRRYDRMQV
jgi:hypothetical protein